MEEYKKVTISFTKEQLEKLDEIMSKEQSATSLKREVSAICHRLLVKISSWYSADLKKI